MLTAIKGHTAALQAAIESDKVEDLHQLTLDLEAIEKRLAEAVERYTDEYQ